MTVVVEPTPIEERFLALTEFLKSLLEVSQSPLDLGEFPSELIRVDTSDQTALGTDEFRVCLYPSDAFLEFETALRARYGQLLIRDSHSDSLSAQAEAVGSDGLSFPSVLEVKS